MTEPFVPELDRQLAMRLAITAASDTVDGSGFDAAAFVRPDSKLVVLTLGRKRGGVLFEQTLSLSRQQTADEFVAASRRGWMFLRGEMDRTRPERETA